MKDKVILALLVAACVVIPGLMLAFPVQTPSATASVPFAPIKVNMQGSTVLAYELEFSDFDTQGLTLKNVKVFCSDNGTLLQSIQGEYLASTLHARSVPAPTWDEMQNGTGKLLHTRLSVFLTVADAIGLSALRHEFTFSWYNGVDIKAAGPMVYCQNRTVPIIGSPLGGSGWLGIETSIATSHHMRSQITMNGVTRCCQRYAVDFLLMAPDQSVYIADGGNNSDYYCYGAELLAVADGIVSFVLDGVWENIPGHINANITMENASGNTVIIDIGGGNYAQYAHAIPGSIRVAVGDHVSKGQVIALMGNSGNSDAPHLHFQLGSNPYGMLASEGLPFLIDSYLVDGRYISPSGYYELELLQPPEQWWASWFTNLEWIDYGSGPA